MCRDGQYLKRMEPYQRAIRNIKHPDSINPLASNVAFREPFLVVDNPSCRTKSFEMKLAHVRTIQNRQFLSLYLLPKVNFLLDERDFFFCLIETDLLSEQEIIRM